MALTFDGRPYVAKEVEPYTQYWLSERYRILLSIFAVRGGEMPEQAIGAYLRLTQKPDNAAERKRLIRAIEDMRSAGVLIDCRDDVSRYDARIVKDYLTHRAFPNELTEHIVAAGGIGRSSRVLDLAGGPGDLALQLARVCEDVSLMELSRGFLSGARNRAKRAGLKLTTLHDSCNRLLHHDEEYDAITVSQALHWLDDVLVCKGVCRTLRRRGSFFVIHSAMDLDDTHPLSFLLGKDSILGRKTPLSFAGEVHALATRLTLLFDALDAPNVNRIDSSERRDPTGANPMPRIVPADVRLFQQVRPYDLGFARAFLTPEHIKATGMSPGEFWADLKARWANAPQAQTFGRHHWAVIQFRRAQQRVDLESAVSRAPVQFEYGGQTR